VNEVGGVCPITVVCDTQLSLVVQLEAVVTAVVDRALELEGVNPVKGCRFQMCHGLGGRGVDLFGVVEFFGGIVLVSLKEQAREGTVDFAGGERAIAVSDHAKVTGIVKFEAFAAAVVDIAATCNGVQPGKFVGFEESVVVCGIDDLLGVAWSRCVVVGWGN
jgi:hypothetical protein